MHQMSAVKKLCITAVCIAFCSVLPSAFHAIGLGSAFSPIHIPVLLCGIVCGGSYGSLCGVIGPILSSVLTGMPGAAMLISMIPELVVYGLTAGLGMKLLRTGNTYADVYISLAAAMLLGRVAGGIAKSMLYMGTGDAFSLSIWTSSYFVSTLPGIICHLILIPVLLITLMKSRVIPKRY